MSKRLCRAMCVTVVLVLGRGTFGQAAALVWTTESLPDRLDRPLSKQEVLAVAAARLDFERYWDHAVSQAASLAQLRISLKTVPPYLLTLTQTDERILGQTEEWFTRFKQDKFQMDARMGWTPALKQRTADLRKAYLKASSWEEFAAMITAEDRSRWSKVGIMFGYDSFDEMQRVVSGGFLLQWTSYLNNVLQLQTAKGLMAVEVVDHAASAEDLVRRLMEKFSLEELELLGGVPLRLSQRDGTSTVPLKAFSDLSDDQVATYRERLQRIREVPGRRSWHDVSPSVVLAKTPEAFQAFLASLGTDAHSHGSGAGSQVAWMGVMVKPAQGGVEITRIAAGGPAEKAKLVKGDVLIVLEKKKVTDVVEFFTMVEGFVPGALVDISLRRGEDMRSVRVALGSRRGKGSSRRYTLTNHQVAFLKMMASARDIDQVLDWLREHPETWGNVIGGPIENTRKGLEGDPEALKRLKEKISQSMSVADMMLPKIQVKALMMELLETVRTKEEWLTAIQALPVDSALQHEVQTWVGEIRRMPSEEFESLLSR